jgi:hypothetical protein
MSVRGVCQTRVINMLEQNHRKSSYYNKKVSGATYSVQEA